MRITRLFVAACCAAVLVAAQPTSGSAQIGALKKKAEEAAKRKAAEALMKAAADSVKNSVAKDFCNIFFGQDFSNEGVGN